MKEELKKREEDLYFYKYIIEHIGHSVFRCNSSFLFLEVNNKTCENLGYSREELLGMKLSQLDASYPDFIYEEYRQEIKKTGNSNFETFHKRKDGSIFPVKIIVNYANYKNSDYFCGYIMDITKKREMEEELLKSKSWLLEAQRIAHIGSWERDFRKDILNWSDEVFRIFEIEPGKYNNSYEAFLNAIHPDDREMVNAVYSASVKEKTSYNITHRILLDDKRTKIVQLRCENVFDNDGNPLYSIGTVQDITELKKREDELKEANITKDKLFSIISHDLRGPIGNIKTFIDILLSGISHNIDIKEELKHLQKLSKSTFALVENLLYWARMQKDEIHVHPQIANLKKLTEEVLLLLKNDACHKQISLNIEINDNIFIYADKEMFKIILRNLISNGIKFTNNHGFVNISATVEDMVVKISVSDNGIGISEKDLSKLLDKNICFSTRGTNREKGTGLGVSLAREFIEKNGGNFLIKSEIGKGSEFVFTIPVGYTKNPALEILLVEDNMEGEKLISEILKKFSHYFEVAYNGLEAMEKINNRLFHIIFMKIRIPKIDGIEVVKIVRNLKGKNFSTPIIALSMENSLELKKACLEAGMNDVIEQPLTEELLLNLIDKYVCL